MDEVLDGLSDSLCQCDRVPGDSDFVNWLWQNQAKNIKDANFISSAKQEGKKNWAKILGDSDLNP